MRMIHSLRQISPATEEMADAVGFVMIKNLQKDNDHPQVRNEALDALAAWGPISRAQVPNISGSVLEQRHRTHARQ